MTFDVTTSVMHLLITLTFQVSGASAGSMAALCLLANHARSLYLYMNPLPNFYKLINLNAQVDTPRSPSPLVGQWMLILGITMFTTIAHQITTNSYDYISDH